MPKGKGRLYHAARIPAARRCRALVCYVVPGPHSRRPPCGGCGALLALPAPRRKAGARGIRCFAHCRASLPRGGPYLLYVKLRRHAMPRGPCPCKARRPGCFTRRTLAAICIPRPRARAAHWRPAPGCIARFHSA